MKPRLQKLATRAAQVLAESTSQVPSPCVAVCVMQPATGQCEGCLRTLQEIGDWGRLPDAGKRQIWQQIQARLLTATQS